MAARPWSARVPRGSTVESSPWSGPDSSHDVIGPSDSHPGCRIPVVAAIRAGRSADEIGTSSHFRRSSLRIDGRAGVRDELMEHVGAHPLVRADERHLSGALSMRAVHALHQPGAGQASAGPRLVIKLAWFNQQRYPLPPKAVQAQAMPAQGRRRPSRRRRWYRRINAVLLASCR